MMYRAHFATSAFDVIDKLNLNLRDIEAELSRRPQAGPAATKPQSLPIPSPSAVRHDATAGIDEGDIKHMTAAWVSGLTGGGSTALHSHSQYMLAAMRGAVNGVCELDANSLIPIGRVPASLLGGVRYQGTWNATTNTPTLATSPDSTTKGFYYKVSVAGTWNSISWAIGDWIISSGTSWDKVDNTDQVTSVFGRQGAVTAQAGDYTAAQVGAEPAVTAGLVSQFWSGLKTWRDLAADVRAVVLTGLSTATNAAISATDSVLVALGKLQAQINATVPVTRGGTGKTTWAAFSTLYASAANVLAELAPNTTTTKKFLRMTGTGSAGATPAWDTLVASDLPTATSSVRGAVMIEDTVTDGSTKAVTSNAVFDALATKAAKAYYGDDGTGKLVIKSGSDAKNTEWYNGTKLIAYSGLEASPLLYINTPPATAVANETVNANWVNTRLLGQYIYANNGSSPKWINGDILYSTDRTNLYQNWQNVLEITVAGGTGVTDQYSARLEFNMKIQGGALSYAFTVLSGHNYVGKIKQRLDSNAGWFYMSPCFYVPAYASIYIKSVDGVAPNQFGNTLIDAAPAAIDVLDAYQPRANRLGVTFSSNTSPAQVTRGTYSRVAIGVSIYLSNTGGFLEGEEHTFMGYNCSGGNFYVNGVACDVTKCLKTVFLDGIWRVIQ